MEGYCIHRNKHSGSIQRCDVADLSRNCELLMKDLFFFERERERFITLRVYTVCTRTNYKIVHVTNLNKYLHYGTNRTE